MHLIEYYKIRECTFMYLVIILILYILHSPPSLRLPFGRSDRIISVPLPCRKKLLEEKFKESEVPNRPAHQPDQKRKGLQTFPFYAVYQSKVTLQQKFRVKATWFILRFKFS